MDRGLCLPHPVSSRFSGSVLRTAYVPNLSPSFFLEATATAYALSSIDGDFPGAFVIAWTLWAVSDHQRSSAYVQVYPLPTKTQPDLKRLQLHSLVCSCLRDSVPHLGSQSHLWPLPQEQPPPYHSRRWGAGSPLGSLIGDRYQDRDSERCAFPDYPPIPLMYERSRLLVSISYSSVTKFPNKYTALEFYSTKIGTGEPLAAHPQYILHWLGQLPLFPGRRIVVFFAGCLRSLRWTRAGRE